MAAKAVKRQQPVDPNVKQGQLRAVMMARSPLQALKKVLVRACV